MPERDAFGDLIPDYAPNQGQGQCPWCTKMTRGPHEGEVIGEKVAHVGTDAPGEEPGRLYKASEYKEAGVPFDFSHGVCTDCYHDQIEKTRASTRRRLIDRQKEEFRQLRARQKQVPGEPTA